ncbi:MAG: tetratricopeptide repeat protein [Deltaproteobacteria bacterium]|nr:tetratricopeptide repeat protein [Deltaproteobacteria bacterium]
MLFGSAPPVPRPSVPAQDVARPVVDEPDDDLPDLRLEDDSAVVPVEEIRRKEERRPSEPVEEEREEDELDEDEDEGKGLLPEFLHRPLFPSAEDFRAKVTVLHAAAAGLGVAVILVVVLVAALGGETQAPPVATTARVASVKTVTTPSAPVKAATPAPNGVKPAATDACRPLSGYPEFPWKDRVATLVAAASKPGVCGVFGMSPRAVAAALKDLPQIAPNGYDLVAGGGLMEAFPGGKPDRRAPSAEFLFVGNGLYEIRLNYLDTGKGALNEEEMKKILGEPAESLTDELGRKVVRFKDGDVVVERVEKKWYGRTHLSLVLASASARRSLAAERAGSVKAEAKLEEGETEFAARRYDKALAAYREAEKLVPSYGLAYVREGLVLVRTERFEEGAKAGDKALGASRENRVRAQAEGLKAVAALRAGDKATALERFKSAASLDPAEALFPMSAGELETGKYAVERVAVTAARMSCMDTKKNEWTADGLLARGNFVDTKSYFAALVEAKKSPKYKSLYKLYAKIECR